MAFALTAWALLHVAWAAVGTWLALRYARRRQLLDLPGERRLHTRATPRGGGIGIVVTLLVGMGELASILPWARTDLVLFCLGLGLVAGIGWRDDHRPMSPWPRLGVHAIAAALLGWIASHGHGGWEGAAMTFVLAIAWVNLWNFMDGIDGIAASQAAIVALLPLLFVQGIAGLLALGLFAACCGFLPFNFPKARIFLGDVGSGALGYAIAALLLFVTRESPAVSGVMPMPLMPFVVDASMTLASRMVRGERWWTPHVEHAYQRLARGAGHVPVTLGYAGASLVGAGIGAAMLAGHSLSRAVMTAGWYALGIAAWCVVQRKKR